MILPRQNQCVFIRHSLPSSLSLGEFAQPITMRRQAGVSLTCKSRTSLPEGRLYSGLPYLSGKQTFDFIVGDYNFSRISIVFLIASQNTQIFIFLFAEGFRGLVCFTEFVPWLVSSWLMDWQRGMKPWTLVKHMLPVKWENFRSKWVNFVWRCDWWRRRSRS